MIRARSASACRKATWCERSPLSAAATAYCIGPGLQSRPSASFLTAASTASSRGVAPDDHPAGAPSRREIRLRQARERNDRRLGIERRRAAEPLPSKPELRVDLVGEDREVVLLGELDQRAADRGGG